MNEHRLVDWKTLQSLEPICDLKPAEFRELANCTYIESCPAGHRLFARGQSDRWCFYLLKGRVRLEAPGRQPILVQGGSRPTLKPLVDAQPRRVDAVAVEPIEFVRLDRDMLRLITGNPPSVNVTVEEISEEEAALSDRLLVQITREYMANRLVVPRLPDVALRVRDVVQRPDADANKVARVIQTDPVLTARLIQVANSPLYGVRSPVRSGRDAVLMLGLENTRNLVVASAMKALFKTDSPLLHRRMQDLWLHSTVVSAIAYVLAQMTRGLNQDRALLLGLLHDIGVLPILHYAGQNPELKDNAETLEQVIDALGPSVGAMVLRRWGFDAEAVQVVLDARSWLRNPGPQPDYADVVLVSRVLASPTPPAGLPPLEEIPAARKLAGGKLDAATLDEVQRRARDEIAGVLQMMG